MDLILEREDCCENVSVHISEENSEDRIYLMLNIDSNMVEHEGRKLTRLSNLPKLTYKHFLDNYADCMEAYYIKNMTKAKFMENYDKCSNDLFKKIHKNLLPAFTFHMRLHIVEYISSINRFVKTHKQNYKKIVSYNLAKDILWSTKFSLSDVAVFWFLAESQKITQNLNLNKEGKMMSDVLHNEYIINVLLKHDLLRHMHSDDYYCREKVKRMVKYLLRILIKDFRKYEIIFAKINAILKDYIEDKEPIPKREHTTIVEGLSTIANFEFEFAPGVNASLEILEIRDLFRVKKIEHFCINDPDNNK